MKEYLILVREFFVSRTNGERLSAEAKERLLKEKVDFIFSSNHDINYFCSKRPKSYNLTSLSYHLSDERWLANFIFLDRSIRNKLSYYEVLSYVRYNSYFLNKRNDFAVKVINNLFMHIEYFEDVLSLEEKTFILNSASADLIFRDRVMKVLLHMGFSSELANFGLEANQSLWRDKYLKIAFDNRFNPSDLLNEGLSNASEDFFDLWSKYRIYEYYKRYKLGFNNVDLLNKSELKSLRYSLARERDKRVLEILDFKDKLKKLGLVK